MFDTHTAQKVAGSDMNGVDLFFGACHSLVTDAADEAVAVHDHIDVFGNQQFHPADESVDVDLLVLADDGLAKIQPQTAAKSVKPCPMECFAVIDILITTKSHIAADALAVFT